MQCSVIKTRDIWALHVDFTVMLLTRVLEYQFSVGDTVITPEKCFNLQMRVGEFWCILIHINDSYYGVVEPPAGSRSTATRHKSQLKSALTILTVRQMTTYDLGGNLQPGLGLFQPLLKPRHESEPCDGSRSPTVNPSDGPPWLLKGRNPEKLNGIMTVNFQSRTIVI